MKKNKKVLTEISRRNFLKTSSQMSAFALVSPPLHQLFDLIAKSAISDAHAEATGQLAGRNYINLLLYGAPLRYSFDHWQKTNVTDPDMIYNPMVANAFTSARGAVTGTAYKSFSHNGILVPHFFSNNVRTSAGITPLTNMLKNMLVIRGYGTGVDGHILNVIRQVSPQVGASSISGVAADSSSKYFQAIQWPDRGVTSLFNSVKGYGINKISPKTNQTPLNALLESFNKAPEKSSLTRLSENNEFAFKLAKARLNRYINSDSVGSKILASNSSNAEKLMKVGIKNIEGYWTEALPRYQQTIESSMRAMGVSGLTDASLIALGDDSLTIQSPEKLVKLAKGFNAIDMISQMGAGNLAAGFALAEFVLKENLCTSIEIAEMGVFYNLKYKEAEAKETIGNYIYDMHASSSKISLLQSAALFRGISAAILELASQLTAVRTRSGSNLWKNTVLQITSDFNRSARSDGTGSDHGFNQMVTSVYSGCIENGPYVVGNIKKTGLNDSTYAGTQGVGTGIDNYTIQGMPNPLMAASTVTELLGVPRNPFSNSAESLVKISNGGLILPFGKGVIKDE